MSAHQWLKIHFLNVDHGDCTIIRHLNDHRDHGQGRISVVDINDWKDRKPDEDDELVAGLSDYREQEALHGNTSEPISPEKYARKYLDDPIDYYQREYSGLKTKIWRFISTHPDMDHLSGLRRLSDELGFSVLWDTEHEKEQNLEEDWPNRYAKEDWIRYQNIREGKTDHSSINPYKGDQGNFWEQDNIQILHPSHRFISRLNSANEGIENPEFNNGSYVLKIKHGNQTILLPGDAEKPAWDEIIDHWGTDILEDVTILKAAHHGVKSGFHKEAVRAMDPKHIILSVGSKGPTDAHHRYRETCSDDTKIWSTRQYGTISIRVMRTRSKVLPTVSDGIFDLPQNISS